MEDRHVQFDYFPQFVLDSVMSFERSNFLGCVVRGVAWLCMRE